VLLDLLQGVVVFLSVMAMVVLSAALIELWIQRSEPKDPDYLVAMLVLKWLSIVGWFVCWLLTVNYSWRFYSGIAGYTVPGSATTTIFSMLSFIACYGFFSLVGVILLFLLWQSDRPTPEERDRRRRVARRRLEAERQRRLRRARLSQRREM
jgi:hypothetical protein